MTLIESAMRQFWRGFWFGVGIFSGLALVIMIAKDTGLIPL